MNDIQEIVAKARAGLIDLYPQTLYAPWGEKEFPLMLKIMPGWYVLNGNVYQFSKYIGYANKEPRPGFITALIPTCYGNWMLKELRGPLDDMELFTLFLPKFLKFEKDVKQS